MATSLDIARGNSNAPAIPQMTAGDAEPARVSLIGLTRTALAATLSEFGIPDNQVRMRASQIWRWAYNRGVTDFAEMSNVSKDLRSRLGDAFSLERPEIVTEQISVDGTRKWLIRLAPRPVGVPGMRLRRSTSPKRAGARFVCRARSDAR